MPSPNKIVPNYTAEVCSLKDAATIADVSQVTVTAWIRQGLLPDRMINGRRLIPLKALRALIGTLETETVA